MKVAFAVLLVVHGLIHLMGAAKAVGLADLPQLTLPISRPLGAVWLVAAVLFVATTIALFASPQWWWTVGAVAILASQVAIFNAWTDARYGTLANAVVLIGVVFGVLSQGPWSVRAQYDRAVATTLRPALEVPVLVEADIASLPSAVQRYVRMSGALGQPRVNNFRARFHGQIRSGPDARWMPFTGTQHNFYQPTARLFLMDASMFGVPFQALHRFVGPSASMRVSVASLFTMVDAKGADMDEAETVTLFNDLCVFAPGALIDPRIQWQEKDALTVAASFTNRNHTVHAVLVFNEAGELMDFFTDERGAASSDGKTFTKMPWSTPLSGYRRFGSHRLMSHGEGVWHAPSGKYAYLHFDLDGIDYNVTR